MARSACDALAARSPTRPCSCRAPVELRGTPRWLAALASGSFRLAAQLRAVTSRSARSQLSADPLGRGKMLEILGWVAFGVVGAAVLLVVVAVLPIRSKETPREAAATIER